MTQWFGPPWPSEEARAPVCANDDDWIKVPSYTACERCGEDILDGESGVAMPGVLADRSVRMFYYHIECHYMGIAGPPAFHERRCRHAGGTDPCFDPDRSIRDQAREVWSDLS